MFDFVRKPFLWNSWDNQLDKEITPNSSFHLKSIQDLAIYAEIKGARGQKIAEIGGGNSRILPSMARSNECVNVEKFEGKDGGPSKVINILNVRNIPVFLGDFSSELSENFFDIVFSVSVVEHVPSKRLDAFFDDGLRILKKDGIWLHAIDLYLEDQPEPYQSGRFDKYRSWLSDERVEPTGPVYNGPFQFTCDIATNPDNIMYEWGRINSSLSPLRQRAQSVSIILSARKK